MRLPWQAWDLPIWSGNFSVILVSMRHGSQPRSIAGEVARLRGLLVLGYQGTLIANPDRPAAASAGTYAAARISESWFESWLERALWELNLQIPAAQRNGHGEDVDHGPLLDALRERLRGMITQIVLASPNMSEQQIACEFPLLAALLKAALAEWVNAIAVFHHRFHRDASRLAAWLGCRKLPGIESLTAAGSDLHEGAHQAIGILFRDQQCIYYKPRSVTGEWLWNRLVGEVNAHSSLRLASAAVLDGANGRYGWVASLLPHGQLYDWDKNSAQAGEYWQAAGATLCLAEHVRMTDLHMANVMATRFGPALFDAESLGSPRAASGAPRQQPAEIPSATAIHDLLDTGLLPNGSEPGLPDTSGLFGQAAAAPQIMIPCWSAGPDGTCRVELAPAALADHGNAPLHASPLEVLPLLVSGYREATAALMRCRDSLLSPQSAWRFTLEHRHAPRIVLRDTLVYGLLASASLRPELLHSAEHRRTAVQRALRSLDQHALPKAIVRTEVRTLLHLQVPRFLALPGSRTLAGSSGRALAPGFFSCPPAESVLRKIVALTPNQLSELHLPHLLMAVFSGCGTTPHG